MLFDQENQKEFPGLVFNEPSPGLQTGIASFEYLFHGRSKAGEDVLNAGLKGPIDAKMSVVKFYVISCPITLHQL